MGDPLAAGPLEGERDWITYTEFATRDEMLEAGLSAFKAEDYETAIKHLLPLAIDGNATAQAHLSQMYRDGLGVPEDQCVATIWAGKAARQGNVFGAWMLAFAYKYGDGVKIDQEMAYRWMKYAAMQGDIKAQESLEYMSSALTPNPALTPEQIAEIDEDMKTWDPSQQPSPEFYYIDNKALKKDNMLLGLTRFKLNIKGCR